MNSLFAVGLFLVLVGVALLIAALLVSVFQAGKASAVGGAAVGCVVVFFIPICFGAGNEPYLTLAAAMLATVAVLLGALQWLLWKRGRQERQE
ncbi:MAG: hypothetical protein ABWK05_00995 [Pyrobaculum sp.]